MQNRHEALNGAKDDLYAQGILLNDPNDPNTTWHKLAPEVKASALLLVHKATGIDVYTLYKILCGAHLSSLFPVCAYLFFGQLSPCLCRLGHEPEAGAQEEP